MAAEVENPLQTLIRERLASGPVPASEVMGLALYHPDHGYYRRTKADGEGPWGFAGKDYYTALDLGPLLGEALAHRFREAWLKLDRPAAFTVLEPGAGRGWLGRDVLKAAEDLDAAFAAALRYLHRDDNPAARAAAEAALAPWLPTGKARFVGEGEPLEPFTGAVFSNELFDALPAQPWRWDGERWVREVLSAEGPEWHVADPCEATAWFEGHTDGLEAGDGSVWAEALPAVVDACTAPLQAGLFLAIDYGERADRLLAKGADLRRYKGHTVDGQWWEDLGTTDLTADVDFSRLEQLLAEGGLGELGHQELSRWIRTHAPLLAWEQDWMTLPAPDRMKRMENLLQLTLPGKMGARFRVLEGWRG